MLRTRIRVRDATFSLAQGHDPEELKTAIVEAAKAGAGFVRFVEVGNRQVSILITAGVSVVIEEEEVPDDPRDDGDIRFPFDVPFDARSYSGFDFTDLD